jgi:NAD(P)-dependent dehydrogenase (short-subunit alcohol dehydrogenase family)
VARTITALGRIDILVSNPAFSRRGDFLEYDPTTFGRVLHGTLFGGFHMSQFVARHMVERGGGGKIVFISSVHARVPYARSVAYNAAKSGLNHMAFTIAAELAKHRINVSRGGSTRPASTRRSAATRSNRRRRRCRGAGSARRKISAKRRHSFAPPTPTTSPARRCWWTAVSGFAAPGHRPSRYQLKKVFGRGVDRPVPEE